jgi:putative ABC transport system ATP-binding protein
MNDKPRKIIETVDLKKSYFKGREDVPVLQGVNLTVEQGEFIAVLGPSGSGKSTLLYLLGALARPTAGKVFIQGEDLSRLNERELAQVRREKIGFIFQRFNLFPALSAYDNLEILLNISRDGKVSNKEIVELLAKVGMGEKLKFKPRELSMGEEQRLAIARAVLRKPAIVLADEPTGNLDWDNAKAVLGLFKSLNEAGQTVIMVTHNPQAASYASRLLRLKDGRLTSEGEH